MGGQLLLRAVPATLGAILACGALLGCYVTHTYDAVRETPKTEEVGSLTVEIAAVAGEVRLGRAGGDQLYDLDLRFCERHFTSRVIRTDSGGGATLSVGLKRRRSVSAPFPGDERNRLDLELGSAVPLDLDLDLGAGRHLAQLGGLRLRDLDVATGSGRVTINFDRPTAGELRSFRANAGPGGLRIGGLGYASPDRTTLTAGGGEFSIDLGGPWDKDGIVQLDVRLGDVTLIVPRDLGLVVAAEEREAGDLILPGFVRNERGDFVSRGFDAAKRRVTVLCSRGLGILRIEQRD